MHSKNAWLSRLGNSFRLCHIRRAQRMRQNMMRIELTVIMRRKAKHDSVSNDASNTACHSGRLWYNVSLVAKPFLRSSLLPRHIPNLFLIFTLVCDQHSTDQNTRQFKRIDEHIREMVAPQSQIISNFSGVIPVAHVVASLLLRVFRILRYIKPCRAMLRNLSAPACIA